jgi:putative two-component system response regulator
MPDRILVVDDDSSNRELMREVLSAQGYEVATAPDGEAGLTQFGHLQPDLVLTDVRMPNMSGIEFCRALKNDPETRLTPVVIMTGLDQSEDRVRGIQAGADEFVTKPLVLAELLARVKSLISLKSFTDELERAEAVLCTLARSIEGKDPYTQGHCERLSRHSVDLGKRVGLSSEQLIALRRAGIVHDIGKVAVPDAILLKPARLTAAERQTMEEHPVVGEKICAPLKSFRLVLPIIRHHHEKLDGSGYPDHLQGTEIPLTARVMQIVDVYDALTTVRPYKLALTSADALKTMQMEVDKGWWDGKIFSHFCSMVQEEAQCHVLRKAAS